MKATVKKITTLLSAFDIFNIFKEEKGAVFLDSGKDKENLGRYSIIGFHPFLNIQASEGICTIDGESFKGDIFLELNKILRKYSIENTTELPFMGGGIGYFSYDLARQLEVLPVKAKKDLCIPDCYFNFYDCYVLVDHLKNETFVIALGIVKEAEIRVKELEEEIKKGKKVEYKAIREDSTEFVSNFTKEQYVNTVDEVREYIESGDIYITNLTQRFCCDTKKDPYEVYKNLRTINPAPFAAFLSLDDFAIVSSSPERFLKIQNGIVETRPIKGTRPRGKTPEEDFKNKEMLLHSEKDKAELLMIVDLERNDLSKVCKPHSVKVTELFKLEEYATVYHLVSTVVGEIKENITAVDCVKACFPGGSITGAPKIRAMEIIEALEPTRRNLYTGCIGYLGFDGNVDLNIVIRTIVMKEERAYFGVGGGITWDSVKEEEYEETLDKAKALMRVL